MKHRILATLLVIAPSLVAIPGWRVWHQHEISHQWRFRAQAAVCKTCSDYISECGTREEVFAWMTRDENRQTRIRWKHPFTMEPCK